MTPTTLPATAVPLRRVIGRLLPAVTLLAATVLAVPIVLAAPASAAVPALPVPQGLPAAIEPLAGYVEQTACDPRTRPGTRKLAELLARTYGRYGAASYATTYACATDGTRSEHYDGRAIDWMVDVHNARQHAAAKAFLTWLLATDRNGDRDAMARRLGVMYVIYDNRMWGAWDGRWEAYNGCAKLKSRADDNACHRTHIHISLSWDGAYGRTSYWTKRVTSRTDVGPCRSRDLNWAAAYVRPNYAGCPFYPKVAAPKGASALKRTLVGYSGAGVRTGSRGPIVSAVQHALHVSASGSFGSTTAAAVRAFQRRRHVTVSGAMTPATWRALLATTR